MSDNLLRGSKIQTGANVSQKHSFWTNIGLPFGNGRSQRINKFYKRQTSLLENYENDRCQIESDNNRRSLRISSCEDDPHNVHPSNAKDHPNEDETIQEIATASSSKVHPALPRVTERYSQSDLNSVSPNCTVGDPIDRQKRLSRARCLAKITLLVNVSLTIAKFVASYLSGSLSIISSLVDSVVDITSGVVIWATSRAITKTDPYHYPVGRTRLEPIALTIVSVIMAVASVQMIVQSLESVVNVKINPHVDMPTLIIMISTICVKIFLFLACRRFREDPSIQILAQDHRNDCLSNSVALVCAFSAQKFWKYLDPLGAIIVALYIAVTWYFTGKEQLVRLSGKSAKPEFINRVIKICIDHDNRINYIDTVYVYHFGTRFLVEVHIVMDQNMRLKETHDVAETLQNNIESLPDVERAFVHVDYDYDHRPSDEHKNPVA